MKHVQMRSVERDRKTGAPVAYGRPLTFPPEVARQMLQDSPHSWEVIDSAFEVPDDTRRKVRAQRMQRMPDGFAPGAR